MLSCKKTNIYFRLISTVGIGIFSFFPSFAQSDKIVIFTPQGAFLSCESAVKFRETVLLQEFDDLASVYEEKSLRYADTLKVLNKDLENAQILFQAATESQRREIRINMAKLVALNAFSKMAITKDIEKVLSKEQLDALSLFVDQSAASLEQVVRSKMGEPVDYIELSRPLIEAIVKIHPQGNLLVNVISGSEVVLEAILKWGPVRKYAYEDAKQLATAIAKLESNTPEVHIRNLNETKNKIDKVCGSSSSYPIANVIGGLTDASDQLLTKNDASGILINVLGASDLNASEKRLTEALLTQVGLLPESSSIPGGVLMDLLNGEANGSSDPPPSEKTEACSVKPDEESSVNAEKTEPNESSKNTEECMKEEWDGEIEKSPMQIAIEQAISEKEKHAVDCGLNPEKSGCKLTASGYVERPVPNGPILTINDMNRRMGMSVPPSTENIEKWDADDLNGRTNDVVSEECDDLGRCTTIVNPIQPVRAYRGD